MGKQGVHTQLHPLGDFPWQSWLSPNDITNPARRLNKNKEPKAASTSVSHSNTAAHWFFCRILGFRPIGHIAPEFAKNQRAQFHI